jgi:hypothetical protein
MKSIISSDHIYQYPTINADPTLADLPVGTQQTFRNTSTGDLEHWGNNNGVIEKISGGGGGVGSQTLDETLVLGNETDEKIIFDDTQSAPAANGAVTKEWLVFKPIIKGLGYTSDFAFRESGTNFGTGSSVNDAIDHVMMWGWNISAGGGLESSSVVPYTNVAAFPVTGNYHTIYRDDSQADYRLKYYNWTGSEYQNTGMSGYTAKRGKTGIGFSLENYYNAHDDGNILTESHQFYIDPLGSQLRISSFTIGTSNNNIDHYRRVSREYLYYPTSPGSTQPDVQYWLVQPGSWALTNSTGNVTTSINTEYQTVIGTPKNVTRIVGTNTDMLVFQNYADITFDGATLSQFVLGNFSGGTADLTGVLGDNMELTGGSFTITSGAKSSFFQGQTGNDAVAWYAGTLPVFNFHNFTNFNFGTPSEFLVNKFRLYSNSTDSFIIAATHRKLNIGYPDSIGSYDINKIVAKEYYVNTKAGDPTETEISAGYCSVFKNTSNGEIRLWVNDGGSLIKTAVLS